MWKALGQMPKVHVLHMWHIHTQVQQRVMGQLLKLATASDDIKEMVANHGGLVQVLQGMQGHPRNNGIQRAGTDLLRCLAFTPRIRHLIADAGAIHVCVCVCVHARGTRVHTYMHVFQHDPSSVCACRGHRGNPACVALSLLEARQPATSSLRSSSSFGGVTVQTVGACSQSGSPRGHGRRDQ